CTLGRLCMALVPNGPQRKYVRQRARHVPCRANRDRLFWQHWRHSGQQHFALERNLMATTGKRRIRWRICPDSVQRRIDRGGTCQSRWWYRRQWYRTLEWRGMELAWKRLGWRAVCTGTLQWRIDRRWVLYICRTRLDELHCGLEWHILE